MRTWIGIVGAAMQCPYINFSERRECRECRAPIEPTCLQIAEASKSADDWMTDATTNQLLVNGLHAETTEATLQYIFAQYAAFLKVQLVRDPSTGSSQGFAYVEFETAEGSTSALDALRVYSGPLEIDGQAVTVTFCKPSQVERHKDLQPKPSAVASAAIGAALAFSNPKSSAGNPAAAGPTEQEMAAKRAASAIAATLTAEAAAAEAAAAEAAAAALPPGVPAGLVHDPTSGYFYDPAMGYYWDIEKQLFYDGVNTRYMSYDHAKSAYVVVNLEAEQQKTAKKAAAEEAKRVAKQMARFEKQQKLKRKETASSIAPGPGPGFGPIDDASIVGGATTPTPLAPTVAHAEHMSDIDDGEGELPLDAALLLQFSLPGADPWEGALQRGHVKPDESVCMLCRTRLPTVEKLQKHVLKSQLHVGKLDAEKTRILDALTSDQADRYEELRRKETYKDRAAERRKMHGQTNRQVKNEVWKASNPEYTRPAPKTVQPTKAGLAADNKGFKMLKLMGWSKGTGLGKDGQGITAPVEAKVHVHGAGIGAGVVQNASQARVGEGSYKEKAAEMARARYNALN
jgi:hypothetical protein